MEIRKQTIFTGWHFMRWVRLMMAAFVAFQAFELQNAFVGLLAGVFLFQALANTGCCRATGCAVTLPRKSAHKTAHVEFEEIKDK